MARAGQAPVRRLDLLICRGKGHPERVVERGGTCGGGALGRRGVHGGDTHRRTTSRSVVGIGDWNAEEFNGSRRGGDHEGGRFSQTGVRLGEAKL